MVACSWDSLKGRGLHLLLIASLLSFSFGCGDNTSGIVRGWWMWTPGDSVDNSTQSALMPGYHPDQPLPFNHQLHAGKRQIPCEYCHSAARRSATAGIPPLNTCMACHQIVKTDAPAIKFLTKHYKENKPIEWIKVHDLPDHVRFSHQPHVLAEDSEGNRLLQCQDCHGQVENTTTAEQWAPLQMGWCIECHSRKVSNPENPHMTATLAPISCNTCHY